MVSKNTITQDDRFKSIHNDPRFIKPSKKKIKAQESNDKDERFQSLTQKKSFKKTQNLKLIDYARARVVLESSDEGEHQNTTSDSSLDSEDEIIQLGPTSNSIQPEIDLNEQLVPELDQPINQIEPTKRIGIVNLDWDHLKPIDIYKVFSSLLSPNHQQQHTSSELQLSQKKLQKNKPLDDHQLTEASTNTNDIIEGHVVSVRFYKSQFGKERMKVEDIEGPPKEIFKRPSKNPTCMDQQQSDTEGDDDEWLNNQDQGDEFNSEALRKYQLDRLRYYYAIVELDSVRTAHHVFTQIDGTEFERTANIFDLSYVSDETTFDEDDLWDECVQDSNDYKGVDFSTDVLRHSKVKLTWDSEDPIRSKYTRLNTQKLKQEELDSMDFKHFLAPPSSEEEIEESEAEHVGDQIENPKLINPIKSKNIRQLFGLTSDAQLHYQLPSTEGHHSNQQEEELDITFKPGFIDLNQDLGQEKVDFQSKKGKTKNQKIKQKLKSKDKFEDQSIMLNQVDQEEEVIEKKNKKNKNKKKDTTEHLDSNHQTQAIQARQELELLMMEEGKDNSKQGEKDHFDLNQIMKLEKNQNQKRRNKHQKSIRRFDDEDDDDQFFDTFSINHSDQRFDRFLVDHPEFAIDPSNPQFKKTRSMMDLLNSTGEKRKAKQGQETGREEEVINNSNQNIVNKPESNHTRLLLNQIKKNSSSYKRPKLV